MPALLVNRLDHLTVEHAYWSVELASRASFSTLPMDGQLTAIFRQSSADLWNAAWCVKTEFRDHIFGKGLVFAGRERDASLPSISTHLGFDGATGGFGRFDAVDSLDDPFLEVFFELQVNDSGGLIVGGRHVVLDLRRVRSGVVLLMDAKKKYMRGLGVLYVCRVGLMLIRKVVTY